MNITSRQRHRAVRLSAGWCVVMLYAGAASPIGPGMAAWLGAFDATHKVSVRGERDGVQVVLHHQCNGAAHRHGLVAKALTIFAQPASAANPDHVLQFSTPETFSRKAQFIAPTPEVLAQPDLVLQEAFFQSPREASRYSVATHPPPDCREQLLCLSSTLLLI